jgi:hypothetical protein
MPGASRTSPPAGVRLRQSLKAGAASLPLFAIGWSDGQAWASMPQDPSTEAKATRSAFLKLTKRNSTKFINGPDGPSLGESRFLQQLQR